MIFAEYVARYVDKTNPETKGPWLRAAVLQDSKVDPSLLDGWIAFVQEFHFQMMQAQHRAPTDAEYIAAWVQAHPVAKPGAIFGPTPKTGEDRPIGSISIAQFRVLMTEILPRK